MKLNSFITTVFFFASSSAFATPCFHQGLYKGMGIGADASGKSSVYSVNTAITADNQASSDYTWSPSGKANLTVVLKAGYAYVNGSINPSGPVVCDRAVTRISMLGVENGLQLQVNEEWAFLGNYLLRHGTKTTNGVKIDYQELLIRQD